MGPLCRFTRFLSTCADAMARLAPSPPARFGPPSVSHAEVSPPCHRRHPACSTMSRLRTCSSRRLTPKASSTRPTKSSPATPAMSEVSSSERPTTSSATPTCLVPSSRPPGICSARAIQCARTSRTSRATAAPIGRSRPSFPSQGGSSRCEQRRATGPQGTCSSRSMPRCAKPRSQPGTPVPAPAKRPTWAVRCSGKRSRRTVSAPTPNSNWISSRSR